MSKPTQNGPAPWVLASPLAALAILIAVASFFPDKRLWGINHLAYYPLALRVVAFAMIAVSFVPVVQRSLYSSLVTLVEFVRSHKSSAAIIVSAALVAGVAFYLLQSSSLLLGDGHLISKSYDKGLAGDMTMVPSSVANIIRYKRIEPGAALLYFLAAKAITGVTGVTPTQGIQIFNVLLGVIFTGVMLWIVVRSSLRPELRLWLGILVFTSGTTELFFGYVEYYTPLVFLGTFYVIALWRVLHGRGPIWLPIVLALVCAYVHVQAILLLPALGLVIVWRFAGRRRKAVLRYVTPTLVVLLALAVYVAAFLTSLKKYFLPLLQSEEVYGVLSPAHWADIANELLILFPAFALFLVLAVTGGDARGARSKKEAPDWFTQPVERHVAGLLLYPGVLYLVFFNPEIGMARDWDLFTILMFGMVPVALLLVNRLVLAGYERLPALAVPVFVMGAILVTAWIGVNASPVTSAERFEDILDYDQSRSDYSYETLSRHYFYHDRLAEAIGAQEKAVAISKNPRQIFNLSVLYKEYGDMENSNRLLQQILKNRPGMTAARHNLILQLFQRGRYQECGEVAREGIEIEPSYAMYHFFYGRCLLVAGRIDEGARSLATAKELGVPPEMEEQIEVIFAEIERMREQQQQQPGPRD